MKKGDVIFAIGLFALFLGFAVGLPMGCGSGERWEYRAYDARASATPIDDLKRSGAEEREAYAYSNGVYQLRRRR